MLSIHLLGYISVHALSYSVIIINQSIHINLSAGAQNITNYACLQAACVGQHIYLEKQLCDSK